jgi:hypothetical protein
MENNAFHCCIDELQSLCHCVTLTLSKAYQISDISFLGKGVKFENRMILLYIIYILYIVVYIFVKIFRFEIIRS